MFAYVHNIIIMTFFFAAIGKMLLDSCQTVHVGTTMGF